MNGTPRYNARCKKNNFMYPNAFYWVEIEKVPSGELVFSYGTGIDTQMLDVYFQSPIEEISNNKFSHKEVNYQLDTFIQHSQLSFSLAINGKVDHRKGYRCE